MEIATLLTTVLPALLPVAIDGVKMAVSKLTGVEIGEPKSFQDWLDLRKADTERIKAIAELDKPLGQVAPWVASFRASFRYFAVGVIVLGALIYALLPIGWKDPQAGVFIYSTAQSAVFFIIGDRVYLGLKHLK